MGAIKTLLTFEEFERIEDEEPGKTELLEGETIHLPPPEKKHNEAGEGLADLIKVQSRRMRDARPGAVFGKVHHEMGYLLGRDPGSWLVPDVSVTWPAQPGDKYYEGAPMIAFEIVSDSNRPAHIARKCKKYLECGAAEVWVVYPDTRHAMIYTQAGERREEISVRSDFLPGIEIPFSDFL
jgi:Uma2 family endonuclease